MIHEGDPNDFISIINLKRLSYVPLRFFPPIYEPGSVMTGSNDNLLDGSFRTEVTAIINKVHKHICGHLAITDIRLLLERNDLWIAAVEQYAT